MDIRSVAAAIAACLLLGAAAPQDWADSNEEWTSSPGYDRSKALCRSLRGAEPPAADAPDAAARASLKGCSSEALYYGIGVAADPVRARQCAFIEAEAEEGGLLFGGRTMLMTIYANGRGAKRDLDVAIHLACGLDGAPAEMDGRILHLAELKETGWAGDDFHYCDDTTSGLSAGHCAGHAAAVAGVEREAALAALTAGWAEREKQALATLRKAHEAFAQAHADGEVDMSGTMRGAFWVGAVERLNDELVEMIRRLEGGEAPPLAADQFGRADSALNAAYRKRMAALARERYGTVTREGVRDAQRSWLRYRDAFLAFAAIRYPRVPRGSVAAWLTARRSEMLDARED